MQQTLIESLKLGGETLMGYFGKIESIRVKDSQSSIVTQADLESERRIVDCILGRFPGHNVIAEETGFHWNGSEYTWVVDPLDGTKEFLKRNGEFTVNIALIEDKRPVLGVIYVPVTGVLYFGARNEGAFVQAPGGEPRPIRVSGDTPERTAVGSRSHSSPEEAALLQQYRVTDHVAIGSSLKFCLIAEGKANFYYRSGPTMEWDTAAGQAIVEAAGGRVTDGNGDYLTYNKPSPLNSSFICTGFLA